MNSQCVFDGAKWIGAPTEEQSPIISKKIRIAAPGKASLAITACGFFEAKINGNPVSDYMFLPVMTDFEKRDTEHFVRKCFDELTHRLYYYTFDVSSLLVPGDNTLEIQLANGWYREMEMAEQGDSFFGTDIKLIYRLDATDGENNVSIVSDGSELWRKSEIVYNSLYIGEIVDARQDTTKTAPVVVYSAPETELCPAIGTPDKIMGRITPKLIAHVDGRDIYDTGVNVSGVVKIKDAAKAGERIVLRFAEELAADGSLDFSSTTAHWMRMRSGKKQIMTDEFISDGAGRELMPKFVWHGFRYFDVQGKIDSAEVIVIHSDTPVTAEFDSDSEGLNFLYNAFIRTQLNNMHGSFPSDCPHRERLGYTGDGQVCAPAAMMTLDSRAFYEKWIQDILDCQGKNGHVQYTAPFMGGGGGPGGWGSSIVLTPYEYYRQYGDASMLEKCYEPMLRWISYLESKMDNYLVTRGEEGGWCLGDWCTLEETKIPEPFVNSCYTIKNLLIIEKIAKIIGKPEDVPRLSSLRKSVEAAVISTYKDESGVSFAGGIQGADAFAVWCGIAGNDTARAIAEKYDALGHFDTGFLCTDILLEVLFDHGYSDVAFKLLSSEELGSFLYMKRHGATSLWEYWGGRASHDHPMFGGGTRHLFTSILGIRQTEQGAGYSEITISPRFPKGLGRASGSIMTPHGRITVHVKTDGGKIEVSASVPEGIKLVN